MLNHIVAPLLILFLMLIYRLPCNFFHRCPNSISSSQPYTMSRLQWRTLSLLLTNITFFLFLFSFLRFLSLIHDYIKVYQTKKIRRNFSSSLTNLKFFFWQYNSKLVYLMTFVIILQYNIIHIISVAPLPGLRYLTLGAKVRGEQYHDFEVFSGFQPSVSQWTTEIDRYSDSWIVIIHNCNYEIPVKKIVSYNEKKCKSLFSIVTTNSFYYAFLPFSSTRPSMKRWVGNPWERIQPYTYPIIYLSLSA